MKDGMGAEIDVKKEHTSRDEKGYFEWEEIERSFAVGKVLNSNHMAFL